MVVFILYILWALFCTSCYRNSEPCRSLSPESAIIPVVVDWSLSGLSPEEDVHRLSLRFFPLDGGDPFDIYLERDLSEATIEVPVGDYSVLAINESISDSYWSGAILFTDVDSYSDISAELHSSDGQSASGALALVAWSLDSFVVTSDMASYSRGVLGVGDVEVVSQLSDYEQSQMSALTYIVMEPRTRTLNVSVTTENLGSTQSVTASVGGLSLRVNLVTGVSESSSISHSFTLDSFDYDETRAEASASGVVSGTQLCFAHSEEYDGGYTLDLEVYLNDGTQHEDEEQLSGVDVGDQVTSTTDGADYLIEHSISLPETDSGSIGLDEWIDGGTIELNGG